MAKREITFLVPYRVQAEDGEEYEKGQTVRLEESSAAHFVTRGVAVYGRGGPAPSSEEGEAPGDE